MSFAKQRNIFVLGVVVGTLVLTAAVPVEAQSEYGPLFDKFNFSLAFSWVGLTTELRLDSDLAGKGTTLSFEDDLDLGGNQSIPTFGFQWQIGRKHKLGVRYQDINRDSSTQALTDIQWGDESIPINAQVFLGFDITQAFIDYTYYPWGDDLWAAGFGGGLRWMEVQSTLSYQDDVNDLEGSSDIKGSAPLPYVYFEYRRMFSDHWRFVTGLGWLYVKIGDIEGGQWIGRAGCEYLVGDRWSFGGAVNLATIDVDWAGVQTDEGDSVLSAAIAMDIFDFSVFARVRF